MSNAAPPPRAIEVFFSYAHEDEILKDKLVKHLAILEREGKIKVWHDRKIVAGDEYQAEISKHLDSADIILLLVSPDFISSDYCYSMEMARAIERHRAKEARVIPVILRPCLWEGASFSGLNALPAGKRACTDKLWNDINDAFFSVAEGLQDVIREMNGEVESSNADETVDEPATNDNTDRAQEDILALLPYLCDRDLQEQDLEEVLISPMEGQSPYPFLCIIYGGEEECHDKFRERLQHRTLKSIFEALGISLQPLPIEDIRLALPSIGGRITYASYGEKREAFFRVLSRNLSKEILGKYNAKTEELIEAISQFKNPVIIHSSLSTAMWEPDGSKIISWFLEFWNDSWAISPGLHLFICLHIEFDRKRGEYIINEEKVRAFLKELDLTQYRKLHVAPLSELESVQYLDAKGWVSNEKNFEGFCRLHGPKFCNADAVVGELMELYRQPEYVDPKGGVPMLKLGPKLRHLIKTNYCQRSSL